MVFASFCTLLRGDLRRTCAVPSCRVLVQLEGPNSMLFLGARHWDSNIGSLGLWASWPHSWHSIFRLRARCIHNYFLLGLHPWPSKTCLTSLQPTHGLRSTGGQVTAMPLREKLKQRARQLKAETFALYLAARHPDTPWYAKLLVATIVAYAFSPIDLIPDFIPIVGYLDDLVLIPMGIALAIKLVPPRAGRMQSAGTGSHGEWQTGQSCRGNGYCHDLVRVGRVVHGVGL